MSNTTSTRVTSRANMTGLVIAAIGIIVFNVSPFLDWVSRPDKPGARTNISGYETDSLVPFIAYLGIGLLVALIYASKLADRGQHRGLTLATMAVGIAAAIQCLAFAMDPMGDIERGFDLTTRWGIWVGLIGALVWALGAGLLAKEPEGSDPDHDHHVVRAPGQGVTS